MSIANSPRYQAAMEAARLVGNNFKTLRSNKRRLAVDLVAASVVEGFALAEAITAAKAQAKWQKLASDERNTLNVLFTAVRVIEGAWKALHKDVQAAFLAGEKVYSTLTKEIKDAEKVALEAADKADNPDEADEEQQQPVRSSFADACTVVVDAMAGALSEEDQLALLALMDAIDAYRSSEAERLAA